MSEKLRPHLVREAKRRLEEQRQKGNTHFGRSLRPFHMADFVAGGMYALELLKKAQADVP